MSNISPKSSGRSLRAFVIAFQVVLIFVVTLPSAVLGRDRISINEDWRFLKGEPANVNSKRLLYDVRPDSRGEDPAKLKLDADHKEKSADGMDLCFVTATVMDKEGLVVPRAVDRVSFAVTGPGEIIAADNGDPTSFESFQTPERKAFNGKCLVIVRSQKGQARKIKLTATADGPASGTLAIGTVTKRADNFGAE